MMSDVVFELVQQKSLTCAQLGNIIGLSAPSASGKLHGRIGWTVSDLVKLANYFHVSTDYLLGLTPQAQSVEVVSA